MNLSSVGVLEPSRGIDPSNDGHDDRIREGATPILRNGWVDDEGLLPAARHKKSSRSIYKPQQDNAANNEWPTH